MATAQKILQQNCEIYLSSFRPSLLRRRHRRRPYPQLSRAIRQSVALCYAAARQYPNFDPQDWLAIKRITLAFIALFTVSFVTLSARAQLGIYGQYSATHIPATSFTGTTAGWYQGFTGGAYYNLLHAGPLGLGLDARGGFAKGQGHNYRNFLIGPRVQIKPPVLPIRPYIQASIGVGGVDVLFNGPPAPETHYSNKLQYGFIGGVDYTLVPHIDIRLAEVGYLRMSGITSGTPAPALNLVTVGAGVVLRLP